MAEPLAKSVAVKLQVKAGSRFLVMQEPPDLAAFAILPEGASRVAKGPADVVLLFTPDLAAVERDLSAAAAALAGQGILWVAYPKTKAAGGTDLNRDILRELAVKRGFVAVSQVAVDGTWSALRFKGG